MKFSEMPYERPDVETLKAALSEITKAFRNAKTYSEAKETFLLKEKTAAHIATLQMIVSIRHSIDTRDRFYKEENDFWNLASPQLEESFQEWTQSFLDTPFRKEFIADYGEVPFLNGDIARKTFSPEIIGEMQQESQLENDYEDLLASAQIPFEGGIYTLAQMEPFETDPDDERRRAAWIAEGQWFKENRNELDRIYDELVHLRDRMGRKLGYDGYTELGYYRMNRNCYTKEDIAKFREAVVKYVVPVAEDIYRAQAERLGKSYPMDYSDNALEYRDGNPRPAGDFDDTIAATKAFYDQLSPETSEFFRFMQENELLDLFSKEGKASGGYTEIIPDYESPFIFANFNNTQGDVDVMTHEAGHAFEAYLNRKRIPSETVWATTEACEVHSMAMEFFGERFAKEFFGKDAEKYLYSHLAGALTFIPYGTAVDHFQHIIYEKPDLTPAERHAVWKELQGIYMPYVKLDGVIPFYGEGQSWQQKHHIYSLPFYYIDYCLAQTVALEFWKLIQEDPEKAWEKYMTYTSLGGSETFTVLLEKAGLSSPFEETCLKDICLKASAALKQMK